MWGPLLHLSLHYVYEGFCFSTEATLAVALLRGVLLKQTQVFGFFGLSLKGIPLKEAMGWLV